MFSNGSLSLLASYGSDSSDDDVPGPKVSTKRVHKSDDEELSDSEKFISKKRSRLPLPELFRETNHQNDHEDDSSLHEGRIRSFAHERGNWATYIYVPCPKCDIFREITSYVLSVAPENLNLKMVDDFHISLTKTVVLKYHWIVPFIESVKLRIAFCKKFMILFSGLKIYCNEERTRTFIGIQIRTGHYSLLKLVEAMDTCLDEFKLPTFYKDPSFHMSIAWCIGDYQNSLETILPELNVKFFDLVQKTEDYLHIFVESLLCKTGNKYFTFELNK